MGDKLRIVINWLLDVKVRAEATAEADAKAKAENKTKAKIVNKYFHFLNTKRTIDFKFLDILLRISIFILYLIELFDLYI